MKKFTSFLFLLASIFSLSSCESDVEVSKEEILPEVEVIEISSSKEHEFKINADVLPLKSVNLSSDIRADVAKIYFRPGQEVKEGDLLLSLKSDSIESAYKTASNNLQNARRSVSQTDLSAINSVEAARVNLEQAQINLKNTLISNEKRRKQAKEILDSAKLNLSLSTESSETNLETAEKNLEKVKSVIASSEASAKSSLENAIRSAKTSAQSAINSADSILGISSRHRYENDSFEDKLGALSSSTKTNAEDSLRKAILLLDSVSQDYSAMYALLSATELANDKTLLMLKNSATGNSLTQSELDAYITTITNELSSIRASLSSLSAAKTSYDSVLDQNDSKLVAAQQAVNSAKKQLNSTTQSSGNSSQVIKNAEAAYNTSLAELQAAKEAAEKQVESAKVALESAQSSVDLSKTNIRSSYTSILGNYEQSKINYEKLSVRAPFSGTIIDIPLKEGDEVNPGSLILQLENRNKYKLVAYLSSSQISRIDVGDTVKIGKKSSDKIAAIASAIDPQTKKHKVEIIHENPFLVSGQQIPLVFTSKARAEVQEEIIVPLVAVHVNDRSFVKVVNSESTLTEKEVLIGEIIGKNIVIKSGLEIGDLVVTYGARLLKTGSKVDIKNSK